MTSSLSATTRVSGASSASTAKWLLGGLLLAGAVFHASQARASDVRFSIGLNVPGVSVVAAHPQYVYGSRLVVPQGYVLGADGVLYPHRVAVQQPNYYVQPAPVYVQPIRGYVAPVYLGNYGHGYRHGHGHGGHGRYHKH